MRSVSNEVRNAFDNKDFSDYPYTCKVVWVEDIPGIGTFEHTIPNVKNVTWNSSEANFSNTASFTMCNVNPDNLKDFGYYTPHRNDSTHNKPSNDWLGVLVINKKIKIYAGWNDELYCQFTGLINSVTPDIFSDGSEMVIDCNDMGKILMEQSVYCVDTANDPQLTWSIIYPIDTSVVITGYHLTSADTDPYLEDIVRDICMRAGFSDSDIITDSTGIRLSDTVNGFFEWENMTWDACINEIKDLAIFDFWINEDGKAMFKYPTNRVIDVVGEAVCMFGVPPEWQPLSKPFASPENMKVRITGEQTHYIRGIDWEWDGETNSIIRLEDGAIAVDEWVEVDYTAVDWLFKNGQNIIRIPLGMSDEKVYGRIKVIGDGGVYAIENLSNDFKLWDGSQISPYKMFSVTNENLLDEEACTIMAQRLVRDMKEKYITVNAEVIPVPALQMKDVIQVVVYGLIGEAYIITGQNFTFDAGNQSLKQTITCHHYSYAQH
jgi:hypothetical protein